MMFRGSDDNNRKGQMHLMEVITASILIIITSLYISSLSAETYNVENVVYTNQQLSSDVLSTLDDRPAENPAYKSRLDEIISTYDLMGLVKYLDSTLDRDTSFNIVLNTEERAVMLTSMGEPKGEAMSVHHMAYLSGGSVWDIQNSVEYRISPGIYDVQVVVWTEPRSIGATFHEIEDGFEYPSINDDPYLDTSAINDVEIAGEGDKYVQLSEKKFSWTESTTDDFRDGTWDSDLIDVNDDSSVGGDGNITLDDWWDPGLSHTRSTYTRSATLNGMEFNYTVNTTILTPPSKIEKTEIKRITEKQEASAVSEYVRKLSGLRFETRTVGAEVPGTAPSTTVVVCSDGSTFTPEGHLEYLGDIYERITETSEPSVEVKKDDRDRQNNNDTPDNDDGDMPESRGTADWTETTQADFSDNTLSGVSATQSPGNVQLTYSPSNGITGDYCTMDNLTERYNSYVDSTINYYWRIGSGHYYVVADYHGANIKKDNASIRWYGYLYAPSSGTYYFSVEADDDGRLWIDGALVVNDDFVDGGPGTNYGSRYLTRGYHSVVVEWRENTGAATARLRWRPPGQSTYSIIPSSNLFRSVYTTSGTMTSNSHDFGERVFFEKVSWGASLPSISTPKAVTGYNNSNRAIPASGTYGWMSDSGITIGTSGVITRVAVSYYLYHQRQGDLQVYLRSPQGTQVTLFSGSSQWAGYQTSGVAYTQEAAPIYLTNFNNQNPFGQWRLRIYDRNSGYTGTLYGWSITVWVRPSGSANLSVQIRFSNNNSSWTGWYNCVNGGAIQGFNTNSQYRYAQYRVTFSTPDERITPTLHWITVTAWRPPNTPSSPSATSMATSPSSGYSGADVSWNTNGNPPGTLWRVQMNIGGSWTTVYLGDETGLYADGSRLHFRHYPLSCTTTYSYRVRAENGSGIGYSSWSSTVSVTTPDRIAPSRVTGLTATADNAHNRVNLSWNASSDNTTSAGDMRYLLYRSESFNGNHILADTYKPVGGDAFLQRSYTLGATNSGWGSGTSNVKYTLQNSGDIVVEFDAIITRNNSNTGFAVGIGDRNHPLKGAGVIFLNGYIYYYDMTSAGQWNNYTQLLCRYTANANNHVRLYYTNNTMTVYVNGREGVSYSSGITLDSYYDSSAITSIGDKTVKIAVREGSASATLRIRNFFAGPLISGTSYTDTTAVDKAPPNVPTKGGSDPSDGSPSHDTGVYSGNHYIEIDWNTPADNGTTYYYFCVAYDKYGNDGNMVSNSGFERDMSWTSNGGSWEYYTGEVNSGYTALHLRNVTENAWTGVRQYISIQAGHMYIGILDKRWYCQLHGHLLDSSYNMVRNIGNYAGSTYYSDWTRIAGAFTADPGVANIRYYVLRNPNSGEGFGDYAQLHEVVSTTVTTGIGGYDVVYDFSRNTDNASPNFDVPSTATSVTSPYLGAGKWYVHLKAGDRGGNWSSPQHFGGSGANDWFGIYWGIFNESVKYVAFDGSSASPHVTNDAYGTTFATHESSFETTYRYEGGYEGFDYVEFEIDDPSPDNRNCFYGRVQFNSDLTQGTFQLATDTGSLVDVQTVTRSHSSSTSTSTTVSGSNSYVTLNPGCYFTVSGFANAGSGSVKNGYVTVHWNILFKWAFDDDPSVSHLYMRAKADMGSDPVFYTNNGNWEDKSVSPYLRTENDLVFDMTATSIQSPVKPTGAVTAEGYVCFEGTSGSSRVLPPDGDFYIRFMDEDPNQTKDIFTGSVSSFYLGGGHFIFHGVRALTCDAPDQLPSPQFDKDTWPNHGPGNDTKPMGSSGSGKSSSSPPPISGSFGMHIYNYGTSSWQGYMSQQVLIRYYHWYRNHTGTYTSNVFDAGLSVRWTKVSWTDSLCGEGSGNTQIRVQVGVADRPSGPWTWSSFMTNKYGSPIDESLPSGRYAMYRVELSTDDSSLSPVLESITINYKYYATSGYFEYDTVETDGEIIYARAYWIADHPPSTTVDVYVSRDGGSSVWIRCTNGRSVIFPANKDARDSAVDNKLRVRVEMSSPDTAYSPQLSYLDITFMNLPG